MKKEIIKININNPILDTLKELAEGTNVTMDELIEHSFELIILLFAQPPDQRKKITDQLWERSSDIKKSKPPPNRPPPG